MRYLISGSRYLLPLLFAIFLITTGCSDGPVSLQEPGCKGDCPKPEIPTLGVSAEKDDCLPDSSGGGVIDVSFEGLVDSVQTEYTATDSIGNEIDSGIAPDSGSIQITTSYSGIFDVHAEDMAGGSKRSASDTALVKCIEEPAGPGQLKDVIRECYDVENNRRDGRFAMTATLGFDRAKLIDVRKDSVLTDSTGITPVEDQRISWDRLYDGSKFKSILYKDGEKIFAEAVFSCDVGPGEIDVETTCDAETGKAGYEISVANGFDYMPINLEGELFEEYGDGTPEPNQTVSESDVPNGDYVANPERSGIKNSKEFSIHCEEKQVPPVSVPRVDSIRVLTVHLNGEDSFDRDGDIQSYTWTLPDGSTKTGKIIEYTVDEPGGYSFDLTVQDDDGLEDTESVVATVEPVLKKCICELSLPGDDTFFVNSNAKSERRVAVEEFEVKPKEPVQGKIGIRTEARYGGNVAGVGEKHEGFFYALRKSGTSEYTIFSDNLDDQYNGIPYVWYDRNTLISPAEFDKGVEYDAEIRHQSEPPKELPDFSGTDGVELRVEGVNDEGDVIYFEFLAYSCPAPYSPEIPNKATVNWLVNGQPLGN